MNAHSLRRPEIEYELKIRNIKIEGNADELRKKLSHCFSNNIQVDQKCIAELDTNEELETCEEKYSYLSKLVDDYDGNAKDSEYKRIQARLWHWYLRAERIPIPAASDTEYDDRKGELMNKIKILVDSLKDLKTTLENDIVPENIKEDEVDSAQSDGTELRKSTMSVPSAVPNSDLLTFEDPQPHSVKPSALNLSYQPVKSPFHEKLPESINKSKSIPVFKWGLKFDGESNTSVAAFLQRAEELSRARGVPYRELYESAVDLFAGTALMWYRSACRRISSWEELKEELKLVFQSADYDDRLQQEILHRTQGDTEGIDLYLAAMDGLFGRLSTPVPEETKLQRILKNLCPFIQDKLCMFNISSLDELRCLGRRAEVGRLRSTTLHPPPRPNAVLEPDLAFSTSRRRPVQGNVAYMKTSTPETCTTTSTSRPPFRTLKCWNCGDDHHIYRDCTRERRIFCYGCGEVGVRKASCPRCQSKNVQGRGSQ